MVGTEWENMNIKLDPESLESREGEVGCVIAWM